MNTSRRAARRLSAPAVLAGRGRAQGRGPLHRTVELGVGGSAEVTLSDGSKARLLLLETVFRQDTIRGRCARPGSA